MSRLVPAWMMASLMPTATLAATVVEKDDVTLDLGVDVKSFMVLTFPYEHTLMPEDPSAQGVADLRAKVDLRATKWFRFQAHHAISVVATNQVLDLGFTSTGVARSAPEAIPLTWVAEDENGLLLQGRTDRLILTANLPHVDINLGRQPISFGHGLVFAPMDLVSPFNPATIDTEYKPGVDAARIDIYAGMTTRFTLAAAHAGSWDLQGTVLAAYAQTTVGLFDIGAFFGEIHGEHVFGLTTAGGIGPVGIHADATVTVSEDQGVFGRVVLGLNGTPTGTVFIGGELYWQSVGGADPSEYLALATTDRFERGEMWTMGRYYAALNASWQPYPTVGLGLGTVMNLADPSALISGSVSWSIGGGVDLAIGANLSAGARPDEMTLADFLGPNGLPLSEEEIVTAIPVRSEFGLYPHSGFMQLKTWF